MQKSVLLVVADGTTVLMTGQVHPLAGMVLVYCSYYLLKFHCCSVYFADSPHYLTCY